MKKILIFVLLFFPVSVFAKEIYSNEYYYEGENNSNFPFKSDIYIEQDFDYSLNKPDEKLNRVIYESEVKGYKSLEKVNNIVIRKLSSDFTNIFRLTEIKIYYRDKPISYKSICIECSGFAEFNFDNNINNDTDGYLTTFSVLYLYLDDYYNPEDLRVDLTFYMKVPFKFSMYWYKDFNRKTTNIQNQELYDYIIFDEDVAVNNFNASNFYINTFSYKLNDKNIINCKWDSNVVLNKDFKYYIEDNVLVYKYTDKLFKYYMVVEDKMIEKEVEKIIYKDKEKYIDVVNDKYKSDVFIKENIVEKNNFKKTFFYKYRYICYFIILLTLFLLGYMLYALIKE